MANAITGLLVSMIIMVLGFALLATVSQSSATSATDPNLPSNAVGLVKLGPLLFVLLIIAGAIGSVVSAFQLRGD